MCAVCINCGKCEGNPRPKLEIGTCPMCGTENEPEARVCSQCGMPLPGLPGGPRQAAESKPDKH